MDFKDLHAILDFAIAQETEAATFYRTISEQESHQAAKELFLQFSAEEEKHRRLLQQLQQGEIESSLDDYQFVWITDIKRSNYVEDLAYSPGMPYRDILMLGAKREEKALALYNLLLTKAEEENCRKVFKILCQEEVKHKLALEGTLDSYMAELGD